ncbi:MAG: HAD family hydrolase, partial [Anaerotignaceae bacterium]
EVKEILGNNFDVTAMSFGKMSEDCGEITCAGINKAFGMKKVLEYYGMDREDSIAFGDGPNDFEMLEFANVGVAMGNAIPQLKEVADMVTTSVMEDGIKNGLEKLNLL